MLSGFENLRSGLDAPSWRLMAAPEAVAPVRDTAGTGARTARGQRDAARDRGHRPPTPERRNGGSVSAPARAATNTRPRAWTAALRAATQRPRAWTATLRAATLRAATLRVATNRPPAAPWPCSSPN